MAIKSRMRIKNIKYWLRHYKLNQITMEILKEIKVPTGEIYTAKGDKGVLEFLTVADYGKDANIKADFLGITRELNGVPNGTSCGGRLRNTRCRRDRRRFANLKRNISMSASQLISRTPKRAYIIAPSVKQKEEILKSIDRYCSLYYITMGSAYNIAQTAMIDAYNAIKEDKKLYRQQTKQSINKALAAYNTWDAKMRFVLADRYQLWLDLSDASEAELKPLVTTLYYCIDNYFLKNKVPKSKIIARMEAAMVLIDIAVNLFKNLFDNIQKKIGKDLRPMFSDGNALELRQNWNNAMQSVINSVPGMPDIDINDDADSVQAAKNIVTKISNEGVYNRAGEYALQVNPEYKPEDYGI